MEARRKKLLMRAGFTEDQVDALSETFALFPHTHDADQITDFEEAVQEVVGDEEEDDNDTK